MNDASLSSMDIKTWTASKDNHSLQFNKYEYIQAGHGDQESPPNEWSLL